MHSAAVKDVPPEWSGKTIVVWGGGESASDIAFETSKVASRVYFCIPNGVWFVPKRVNGWPPFPNSELKALDHISSRLRLWLSPTHRYAPFVYEYLEWAFGFNGHGQEPWRTPAPYQRSFLNKSSDVLSRVASGHVVPKRDIASCRGTMVRFTDGTSAEVDTIITCSGYTPVLPFLDESVPAGTDPRKWFKYIFYTRLRRLPSWDSLARSSARFRALRSSRAGMSPRYFPARVGSRGRPSGARSQNGTPGSGITSFATRHCGSGAWWIILSMPTSSPG